MSDDRPRPLGGNCFEAVQIEPEGWLCLGPWVQNPDGYWWRPHIAGCERYGNKAREWAQHMAEQINRQMKEGAS